MTDSLALLDQALTLGESELSALADGDVDSADSSAQQRSRLIAMAWGKTRKRTGRRTARKTAAASVPAGQTDQ